MTNKHSFFSIEQPLGKFYVTHINASEIIPLSESNERTPYNSTGIQRHPDTKRIADITKFCEDPKAMFPTPFILSGNSNYFTFYDKDNNKIDGFTNLKEGSLSINASAIEKESKFFSIVDGQHRLKGINASPNKSCFDLLVIFIFDTENYQDAEIFSLINRNQKQVSKSLVYDLYGLSNVMTVEKFAHETVRMLNISSVSRLKNNIKMLGYKTDDFQKVTQGAFVDQLLPLLSRDLADDNRNLGSGEQLNQDESSPILRQYLIKNDLLSVQILLISFFNSWIEKIKESKLTDTLMEKTVGFIAGIKIFNLIMSTTSIDIPDSPTYMYKNIAFDTPDNELSNIITESNIDYPETMFYKILDTFNFDNLKNMQFSSSLAGAKRIVDYLTEYDPIEIRNYLEERHYDYTEFAGNKHAPIPDYIHKDLHNYFVGIRDDEIKNGWDEFCESGVNRDDKE